MSRRLPKTAIVPMPPAGSPPNAEPPQAGAPNAEALWHSFAQGLDHLGTAFAMFDRQGRYVFVNRKTAELTGIEPERLLGAHYLDHGLAERGGPFDVAFERVIADRETRSVSIDYEPWGRQYDAVLVDAGEHVLVQWHETTDEVRERRRREELSTAQNLALQAAQAERGRWRTLFEQAPAQISIMEGPEYRYAFVNERAARVVPDRQLVGRSAREALPELAGSPLWDIVDRVYQTGTPWIGQEVPVAFAKPDGQPEERFYTFVYQPYRDDAGNVAGIMTFGFEVTEQVRVRQALERSLSEKDHLVAELEARRDALARNESRLAKMFDANLIGKVFWTDRGRITKANDAFLRQLGYTSEDVDRGMLDWGMLLGAPEGAAIEPPELERTDPFEVMVRARDGRLLPMLASSARFNDGSGDGVSYFADLSRVKGAEGALREALAREQDAREQAEAANRAKDQFLAVLGHELRNPLAPIAAATHLLRAQAGDRFGRELDILDRQVRHLSRLVDDLLDLSRVTRGTVELRRRTIEIAPVIAQGIEMAERLIEAKQQRFVVDVPENVFVEGDEARIAQVIGNLLNNAAKFTDQGGEIRLVAELEPGWITIRIRDTGVGLAPEIADRLFEPFVQGPQRPTSGPAGLGIGLALVRALVLAHGGEVKARSDGPGLGSEFTVRLPVTQAQPSRTAEPTPDAVESPTTTPKRRVLVVDDNEDAAQLLGDALSRAGHEVRLAYDGAEALDIVDDWVPQIAFVDLAMPIVDGFELAVRMRERFAGTIPLVAVTGFGQASDRERTAAAGFSLHLVKPVDVAGVLTVVQRLTN